MSRKTAYTPKIHSDLIDALRAGCTLREACAHAGLQWDTWTKWRARVRKGDRFHDGVAALVDEYEQAAGQGTAALIATIRTHGKKDFRAAAFLVTRRDELVQRRLNREKLRAEIELKRTEIELARLKIAAGGIEKHEHTIAVSDARTALAEALAGSTGAAEPDGASGDAGSSELVAGESAPR